MIGRKETVMVARSEEHSEGIACKSKLLNERICMGNGSPNSERKSLVAEEGLSQRRLSIESYADTESLDDEDEPPKQKQPLALRRRQKPTLKIENSMNFSVFDFESSESLDSAEEVSENDTKAQHSESEWDDKCNISGSVRTNSAAFNAIKSHNSSVKRMKPLEKTSYVPQPQPNIFQSPDAGTTLGNPRKRRLRKRFSSRRGMTRAKRVIDTDRMSPLLPVPRKRPSSLTTYSSLFRRLEFFISGFSNESNLHLSEVITAHGGSLPDEKYLQDGRRADRFLVAVPNACRKRKFLSAIAHGIPIVHCEFIQICIASQRIVDWRPFRVPLGYAASTQRHESHVAKRLRLFADLTIGIPNDMDMNDSETSEENLNMTLSLLKACGASKILNHITIGSNIPLDIMLSDQYTKTCEHYAQTKRVPIKDFSWVVECMISQRLVNVQQTMYENDCSDTKRSLTTVIAGNQRIKLHIGEFVQIATEDTTHFLTVPICEIQRFRERRQSDRSINVEIEVRVLSRGKQFMALSRRNTIVQWIQPQHILKRVAIVSRNEFLSYKYRDESLFYFEDEDANECEKEKPCI